VANQRSPIVATQATTIIDDVGATETLNRLISVNLTGTLPRRNRPHVG